MNTFLTLEITAYLGPGLGAGALSVVLGLLAAFFMAIVGVVYYPIKRLLKKRRGKKST